MSQQHNYALKAVWKGNSGNGTSNVKTYDRSHTITVEGKPELNITTGNPFVGRCDFFLSHAFIFIPVFYGRSRCNLLRG